VDVNEAKLKIVGGEEGVVAIGELVKVLKEEPFVI
jgi:hypothetical protein